MKPLPDTFALQSTGDRWLVIAPAEHEFRARTYDRWELRAVDSGSLVTGGVSSDADDKPY
jgi:hypothetical protein